MYSPLLLHYFSNNMNRYMLSFYESIDLLQTFGKSQILCTREKPGSICNGFVDALNRLLVKVCYTYCRNNSSREG